jgi:Flp pilus assembly protein TadG
MRRLRAALRGRGRDERGIGAVMTLALFLVLIGFVALATDGGLLWRAHVNISNAADSAALAAAQSYAGGVACPGGNATAQAQADGAATANQSGASLDGTGAYSVDCTNGFVTVRYRMGQTVFLAPLFGTGSPVTVKAEATARWGQAGAANTPPIMISQAGFNQCLAIPNQPCTITYDPTAPSQWGGVDITPAAAGTTCLGLPSTGPGWNVCAADTPKCAGNSAQTDSSLFPTGAAVELNQSGTTWACADNGASASVWANFNNTDVVNQTFCFPMIDQTKTQLTQTGAPLAYDVIGFAPMKVISESKQGNTFFLTLKYTGASTCGQGVIGPPGTGFGGMAFELYK